MDVKHWGQHNATIHSNWILAIPAGMTGGVSIYVGSFDLEANYVYEIFNIRLLGCDTLFQLANGHSR